MPVLKHVTTGGSHAVHAVFLRRRVFQLIVELRKLTLELRNLGKLVISFETRVNHLWSRQLFGDVYRAAVLEGTDTRLSETKGR